MKYALPLPMLETLYSDDYGHSLRRLKCGLLQLTRDTSTASHDIVPFLDYQHIRRYTL